MGNFIFVVNAAWWAMGDENVDLWVVFEDLPGFFLGEHDGFGIGFVADAALEAGEGLALELPGGGVEVHDANFGHIIAAAVVTVDADFRNMRDFGERKQIFPGEIAEGDNNFDIFVFDSLDEIDAGATVGEN